MSARQKPVSTSDIVAAYVDEKLSMDQCAARFGVAIMTIHRRLKSAGIQSRPKRAPAKPKPPKAERVKRTQAEKIALRKAWRVKNRERIAEYNRQYKSANKERDAEKNIKRSKEWIAKNRVRHDAGQRRRYAEKSDILIKKAAANKQRRREADPEAFNAKTAAYMRKRRQTEIKFAVSGRMSNRVFLALRRNKEGRSWKTMVDYTLDDLVERLNSTMPDGYTWDDFLSGAMHIDHEIPVAAFNFTSPADYDFRRCWALKNLRLLPALANLKKGAKLAIPFQPALL